MHGEFVCFEVPGTSVMQHVSHQKQWCSTFHIGIGTKVYTQRSELLNRNQTEQQPNRYRKTQTAGSVYYGF
jgi:hypothetical protein